jgi:hypothetical protein
MIWGRASAAVPALSGGMLLLLSMSLMVLGYKLSRRERPPRWVPWMTGLGAALLPVALVRASTFTVPVAFTNGTVADANQVNQNFTAVAAEVDTLRKQTSVITESEYRPRDFTAQVSFGFNNGGAVLVGGTDNALIAPIHVPSGATITGVDVWVTDANSTGNLRACLFAMSDQSAYDSFACVVSSGTPGPVKLSITPFSPSIQGGTHAFQLGLFSITNAGAVMTWPTDNTLLARNAYVRYEVP